MAVSLSSSIPSLSPPGFTPIQECEGEGREDDESTTIDESVHHRTPLHHSSSQPRSKPSSAARKRLESDAGSDAGEDRGVSCNRCRPSTREKFSVVPVYSNASPNGLLKSIFSSLVKKSSMTPSSPPKTAEERWKMAASELSHKLVHTTKKRDEAVLEVSRLKYSMAELEKKLNKLEIYCDGLNSGLEVCANNTTEMKHQPIKVGDHDKVIEHFLVYVSESRSSVRHLSRSLTAQLRQVNGKVNGRIVSLLQPFDAKFSLSTNPRVLILYLESLLNRAFFKDFESTGFQKSGSDPILNPIHRCESNFKCFTKLKELAWEEVLNKGTKQFSEEFSKFCDRKMSEIVGMLGWNRAWPEPLLQAFFGASKAVWLVHLLANSVHPGLPIFRVDKGVRFDTIYMEDMGGDRAQKSGSSVVRVMVEPGFYIYGNVVKCKVICRYHSSNGISSNFSEKGLNPLPK